MTILNLAKANGYQNTMKVFSSEVNDFDIKTIV
jgi:hypothetical protein